MITFGDMALEFDGLDDETPFLTIKQTCQICGAEVSRRDLDVRDVGDHRALGSLLGEDDANAARAHLQQIHGATAANS